MDILVTGGAGFIGSNYVHHLLNTADDVEVTTLDALTYAGSTENLEEALDDPRHEFIEGDICNGNLIGDVVEQADTVVNFAAESHVDRSIDGAAPFVETNVKGLQSLLDAALATELDRFIQVSTDEVYGQILDGDFTEDDPLAPRNPYAATKAGADLLAQSYYKTHDLPVLITRSSNNYGPRQHPEKLIPKLIRRALRGEALPLYGDGTNVREWTYVADNCRAIETVRAQGAPGEIYNVGSNEELTNRAVAEQILDAVEASRDLIEFVEDRPGHDHRYALDSTKIRNLGWSPKEKFGDGLDRTIEHYRQRL
jgi:dTDP-glucose 4,6-dehydratase